MRIEPDSTRPSMDQTLMDIALVMSNRATCGRKQVGAVIAREGRVIVTGYNGPPSGMPHCDHSHDVDLVGCEDAVHAEANALAFAAKHGLATKESTLFTTLMPCLKCAQLIINAGIVKVVYLEPYRDMSGIKLLERASVQVARIGVWVSYE